ncbi:GAF and ANTAR domain-containing protein [Streptomyces sp. CA-256286]|uniref:GAF and ANTAR domain-containing protein n=1 Tax=Streptomyces sp. CA-256286 TaxID=2801033 RepID=UPI001A9A058C|nr:GAF and ANTAR domain-containing protein [Streptomyces sp. CA-256286]
MSSQKVAQAFVSLVDTLDDTIDSSVLMNRLVSHSVTFTDADAAGLLMVSARGGLRPMAVSDESDELLAVVQQQTSEGPATESWLTGEPVRVLDLMSYAQEWPGLTAANRRAGFRSACAHPLRVRHQTVGVLVLLRKDAEPFDEDGLYLAGAFADVTAVALMQWRSEPLRAHDIVTRTQSLISAKAALETAKGMLAAHADLSVAEAGEALTGYARDHGLRLGTVARELVSRTLRPETVVGSDAASAQE